jgi:hypothetical protein
VQILYSSRYLHAELEAVIAREYWQHPPVAGGVISSKALLQVTTSAKLISGGKRERIN